MPLAATRWNRNRYAWEIFKISVSSSLVGQSAKAGFKNYFDLFAQALSDVPHSCELQNLRLHYPAQRQAALPYRLVVASLIAKPTKTTLAARFRIFWARRNRFSPWPSMPDRIAMLPKTSMVDRINRPPSSSI